MSDLSKMSPEELFHWAFADPAQLTIRQIERANELARRLAAAEAVLGPSEALGRVEVPTRVSNAVAGHPAASGGKRDEPTDEDLMGQPPFDPEELY
jgi:hypothetical protein